MKHHLSNLMLAGFLVTATTGPVLAQDTGKVCLSLRDIYSTEPARDGKSIDFKLRSGAIYHNDLNGRCPDLWFSGFKWVVQGPEMICDNEQSIHVLQSGQVCTLGKFTQLSR